MERALRERIRAEGPITVEAYMEACNSYYYATRDPLGAAGDFTTAPEISQMFGELVGACLVDSWTRAGKPSQAVYAELGPGRGTLAADALRVLRRTGFEGGVHLVETSPLLKAAQAEAVPGAEWRETIETLPDEPLLVVANEFFDALPIRQHVGGIERRVAVAAGGLAFDRDGQVVETSPARDEAVTALAAKVAAAGGVALIVDYGHGASAPGDTLQAVRSHRFAPVLADPGEQDLTAHVDFGALAKAATAAGVEATALVDQGEWLNRLGLQARAAALATTCAERTAEIESACHRLSDPNQMGRLFKVLGVHSREWPRPAGF